MERMVIEAHWGYISLLLKANEVAEKGKLACIDLSANGIIVKGRTATTLIPLGVFHETLTGDGVKKVHIKLFREIQAIWWNNDTGSPIGPEDVGTIAYIKDDQTVTATATGASPLGLILATDTAKGVLVYSPLPHWPAAS
jgi:hypothetical protein